MQNSKIIIQNNNESNILVNKARFLDDYGNQLCVLFNHHECVISGKMIQYELTENQWINYEKSGVFLIKNNIIYVL